MIWFIKTKFQYIFTSILIIAIRVAMGSQLHIENNGPVIVGSNITFFANLTTAIEMNYEWQWEDNANPPHKILQTARLQSNITLAYDLPGKYVMKLTIKKLEIPFTWEENNFKITATIPGKLEVYQYGQLVPPDHYVTSLNETELVTRIHDPSGYFKNAHINFIWTSDSEMVIGENGPNWTHTFDPATEQTSGNYVVQVAINAFVPDDQGFHYASGMFTALVKCRAPIQTINITGNVMLEHGEILDLQVDCDGSPPFTYCWTAVPENNGTLDENATCTPMATTTSCEIVIIYYYGKSGHHEMLVNISNDLNRKIRRQGITVYTAVPEPQLSTVITPVVCSLLAVAIVVVGIFSFVQSRRRFTIEVADFDFTSPESFTYRTFCEQLKDALSALKLPGSNGTICERGWSFLDCTMEPAGDNLYDDDIHRDIYRRDRFVESAEDVTSIRDFYSSN